MGSVAQQVGILLRRKSKREHHSRTSHTSRQRPTFTRHVKKQKSLSSPGKTSQQTNAGRGGHRPELPAKTHRPNQWEDTLPGKQPQPSTRRCGVEPGGTADGNVNDPPRRGSAASRGPPSAQSPGAEARRRPACKDCGPGPELPASPPGPTSGPGLH